jgi:integrase
MPGMPRPRKPYVQREVSRHGKVVWYFRRGEGKRLRLNAEYDSPEFLADYERALANTLDRPIAPKSGKGTVAWLIERYQDSLAFTKLAESTQAARRNILKGVAKTAGAIPIKQVTRKAIAEGRDRRSATPAAAVNFVKVMSALFKWAVDAGLAAENPAAQVEHKAIKTDGHHSWTVDEVKAYIARHPVGTRARLAMDILLFTGMRGSDAVLFGRQHVRDGVIRYRSLKTKVDVELPLLAPLKASIDATPTGDLAFLVTEWGRPFESAKSFQNWFGKRCVEAGVPGRAHGLRKAGATIAAEQGASDQQLMAMWGWLSPDQAGIYTRRAQRGKLAAAAGKMLLDGQSGNSLSPHLPSNVPAPAKKRSKNK